MITYIRTNSDHKDFDQLIVKLDQYLAIINGEENDFFVQHNSKQLIEHVVLGYDEDKIVACGAFKKMDEETVEIKRMFVLEDYRGKGVASQLLTELENWAKEINYKFTVLETSKVMLDAVGLYTKMNYKIIPNYGQYEHVETSVCMKKEINQ